MLLLDGCSRQMDVSDTAVQQVQTVETETQVMVTGELQNQSEPTSQETESYAKLNETTSANTAKKEKHLLTSDELSEIEDMLNGRGRFKYLTYGFLQSGYESPEYVDLGLVLYCGAGIKGDALTDAEKEAYRRQVDEIYTDMTRLTTKQINTFCIDTMGIELKDHKGTIYGSYLPEFDAYYFQHGDTNFRIVHCISGYVEDNHYYVLSDDVDYYFFDSQCLTVLKKSDDNYLFVSNQFIVTEGVEKNVEELNGLVRIYHSEIKDNYQSDLDFSSNIFETDKRIYTKHELLNMNPYLLEIARNEIYARNGYIFESSRLKEFFKQFSWYQEQVSRVSFSDDMLNKYEIANRDLIKSIEVWRN